MFGIDVSAREAAAAASDALDAVPVWRLVDTAELAPFVEAIAAVVGPTAKVGFGGYGACRSRESGGPSRRFRHPSTADAPSPGAGRRRRPGSGQDRRDRDATLDRWVDVDQVPS